MTDQQQPSEPATGYAVTDQVAAGPWRTDHVRPGTGYADAPEEHVPPGWYVVRGPAELDPETPCDAFGSIHVQKALDSVTGEDIAADVAARIADLLNDLARMRAEHSPNQSVLFGGAGVAR